MASKNISILNAVGVNSLGGRNVLDIFKGFKPNKIYFNLKIKKFYFLYFYRMYLDFYFYFNIKSNETLLIYLSGMPPLIKSKAFTQCCFQNANIFFKNCNLNFFSWLFSLDSIRFFFFKIFSNNVDQWIVFSQFSKKILIDNNINDYKIKVVDIFSLDEQKIKFNNFKSSILSQTNKKYNLIYPADNLNHKNHINVFNALIILAKSNIYPRVLFTLDIKEKKNSRFLKLKKLYNLNVDFKIFKKKDMIHVYKNSEALIYPSLNETVGLPIHEALRYNLIIIASNLVYVRQFIKSNLLFDPLDPKDIARKINFFLNKKNINFSLTKNKINFSIKEFKKIF